MEGGLELSCWKEFSRARDLVPSGTKVSICTILVLGAKMNMMVGLVGKSGQFLLFDCEESLTFWVEYFCGKDILSYLF